MEVFQTILMVIGVIALLWLVVKFAKWCLWCLGELFEAGFRNKFPNDFMMHFDWIISEMEKRGFAQEKLLDAGSEYPGILMRNAETCVEMEIRLRAPLFSDKGYSIIVSNHNDKTAVVMQNNASEKNKLFLVRFLENCG